MAQPKLLEQYRERLRVKHYNLRRDEAFPSHLATEGRVAPSNQNQALAALLVLHREVQDPSTTMIYTHVPNKGGRGVTSPFDRLSARE